MQINNIVQAPIEESLSSERSKTTQTIIMILGTGENLSEMQFDVCGLHVMLGNVMNMINVWWLSILIR